VRHSNSRVVEQWTVTAPAARQGVGRTCAGRCFPGGPCAGWGQCSTSHNIIALPFKDRGPARSTRDRDLTPDSEIVGLFGAFVTLGPKQPFGGMAPGAPSIGARPFVLGNPRCFAARPNHSGAIAMAVNAGDDETSSLQRILAVAPRRFTTHADHATPVGRKRCSWRPRSVVMSGPSGPHSWRRGRRAPSDAGRADYPPSARGEFHRMVDDERRRLERHEPTSPRHARIARFSWAGWEVVGARRKTFWAFPGPPLSEWSKIGCRSVSLPAVQPRDRGHL